VITPHPLEAARLLGCDVAQVQCDRLVAAQALADQLGCCVVLKGSGSVIAAPGCIPVVNPSGNAALATPGSGDVLAGWLAGHWSQAAGAADAAVSASAQALVAGTLDVCAAAVWSHGRGAELASPCGMALPASLLIAALGDGRRAGRV
jgi:NAD(P)H-hydrate repair Nnr-like enzyme with NAD(P)H-hydrate dehydratase domain